MRPNYLALLVSVFPLAANAQQAPTEAFRDWARQHVHTIDSVDKDIHDNADLSPLGDIIGAAHVVAFGEPFHGGHEPLAMRNRLIRYAVTQLGFTAVALETGLSTSKLIYDHVLGKTDETDSALKASFGYGFGRYPENQELIRWLRTWNAAQPPGRRVHFYGIDLTGQLFPDAHRSVEAVLTFVDHADPDLGRETRKQYADLIPVFRTDKYVKLTSAEKDAITGKIHDMVALIRRERIPLTASTSRDEYEWALRQAVNAAQDDAFLRTVPPDFNPAGAPEQFSGARWEHNSEMRELAMADNLMWVQQRESSRGKTFFFAHDGHVKTNAPTQNPLRSPTSIRPRPAGRYLRSALDRDMVVIGTYFGHGTGFPADSVPLPPDAAGMDGLLSSLSVPCFAMDLRELPSSGILQQWFQAPHETRNGHYWGHWVPPAEAYDAILFFETVTPTPAPRKQ